MRHLTSPVRPSSNELREFYRERSEWRNPAEERMRFRTAAALARVPDGSTVLDVGCRDGGLRRFLPANVLYQGIDIAPEFARPDILIRDISSGIPFEDSTFDFVFCIEMLEHVPNPYGVMSEYHRVLKPAGVLVLSVPNPYHVKELIWNLLRIPDRQGHIYSWTRQAMTKLGDMSGFDLDDFRGTYLVPPIPMVALLARSIVYRFAKR